jgi:hypothetical protein
MGWADRKIKNYSLGHKASLLEKLMLEQANPVCFVATILAFIVFSYGMWVNDLAYLAVAFVLGLIGHLYCWFSS